jgi:acetolactate synthase-1/2/3 large subunit
MAQIAEWKSEYTGKMKPIEREDEVLPDEVIKTLCRLAGEDAIITTEVDSTRCGQRSTTTL